MLTHQCIEEEEEYLLVSDDSGCIGVDAGGTSANEADTSGDHHKRSKIRSKLIKCSERGDDTIIIKI